MRLDPVTEAKVTHISLGTLKRLPRNIREREYKKIHGTTKPGILLKNQIPLRTGQWEQKKPGFEEMDLVAHCGDRASGDFAHTLNTTDIHTQWFEAEAVLGKAQERVFKAVQRIRGVCRLNFWALILIMTDRLSIIRCIATVLRNKLCSLGPVLTREMIMPILSRRTGHA